MDAILTPPTRLAETLGTKLRRLAQGADRGNPAANLPWKTPPAYAQGVAYKPGNVVASSGNWYVAANTATSVGASGPNHANADPVFDGSSSTGALWSYVGPAQMAADDANAPSLSIAASPTLPNLYRPNIHPERFRVLGASPSAYLTTRWQFDVFQSKAGTVIQGLAASVEFMIDEGQFEIEQIAATNGLAILVDGRFLSADAIVSAASDQWIKVTIPGGRRARTGSRSAATGAAGISAACAFPPPAKCTPRRPKTSSAPPSSRIRSAPARAMVPGWRVARCTASSPISSASATPGRSPRAAPATSRRIRTGCPIPMASAWPRSPH